MLTGKLKQSGSCAPIQDEDKTDKEGYYFNKISYNIITMYYYMLIHVN